MSGLLQNSTPLRIKLCCLLPTCIPESLLSREILGSLRSSNIPKSLIEKRGSRPHLSGAFLRLQLRSCTLIAMENLV